MIHRSVPPPCRLSFARALQPQQDSIKPCASCVIPTSCTQGQECSPCLCAEGGLLHLQCPCHCSPVRLKTSSCVHGNQAGFLRMKPQWAAACFYQAANPKWNNHRTSTSRCCTVQREQQMAVLGQEHLFLGQSKRKKPVLSMCTCEISDRQIKGKAGFSRDASSRQD